MLNNIFLYLSLSDIIIRRHIQRRLQTPSMLGHSHSLSRPLLEKGSIIYELLSLISNNNFDFTNIGILRKLDPLHALINIEIDIDLTLTQT